MLARQLGGGLARLVGVPGGLRLGDERAQAGVHGQHVRPGQRLGQYPVGVGEYVVHVLGGRHRLGPVAGEVGIGGPDDPPLAPRDEEQHALVGAHDHAGVGVDRRARRHDVHALGHAHVVAGLDAARLVDEVRPDPGADDDPRGVHVELAAGLLIAHPRAGHPGAAGVIQVPGSVPGAAQQFHRARAGHHDRAVRRRGPGHRERVPRVVDLGVVVHHRAGQPVGPQRGRAAQRPARGEVPVIGHRSLGALHRVVDHQAGADVRALDHLLVDRVQERHRPHQVRRQLADQQVALAQRLLHELEVALLQVAQPPVDQLAGPARRARGQVARLHEADPQPSGRGIQGRARAGDATPDDKDVQRPGGQLPQ